MSKEAEKAYADLKAAVKLMVGEGSVSAPSLDVLGVLERHGLLQSKHIDRQRLEKVKLYLTEPMRDQEFYDAARKDLAAFVLELDALQKVVYEVIRWRLGLVPIETLGLTVDKFLKS